MSVHVSRFGRLATVVGIVAGTSIGVAVGASRVAVAAPSLTIPSRVYPEPGVIMDFADSDPVSNESRTITVSGLQENTVGDGCNPSSANEYDVQDCPNVQLQLTTVDLALLLRIPDNAVETVNGVDHVVNSTGAVITQHTDSQGLDSFVFHVTGQPDAIQATLDKLQLVPCQEQEGTADPSYDPNDPLDSPYEVDCGYLAGNPEDEPVYEEKRSSEANMPSLSVTAVDHTGSVIDWTYIKVEGTNAGPVFGVTQATFDVAAGGTLDLADEVPDNVTVVDPDACNTTVCGASWVGADMYESEDDEHLLVAWIPEQDCGTFAWPGGAAFGTRGGGSNTSINFVVQAWTGFDLGDPDQADAAVDIADAVEPSLSPTAWGLDLSAQPASQTAAHTVFAATAEIDEVRYALANIEYTAPDDDATCHLNIAVSDLGNNGAPLEFHEEPVKYEQPDAQGAATSLTFDVADAHPDVTVEQVAPGPLGDPAGPNKPAVFLVSFSEPVDGLDAADLTIESDDNDYTASIGSVTQVPSTDTYAVEVSATGNGDADGEATLTLTLTSPVYADGHTGEGAYANDPPDYSDNEITWDDQGPTAVVAVKSGQGNPIATEPVTFTVEWSDTISTAPIGFDENDVELSGTAGATTVEVVQPDLLSLTDYEVRVTGMTDPGTVTIKVTADAIVDQALNGSEESAEVTADWDDTPPDTTAPTVAIAVAAGQDDPTDQSSVDFTVTFSEDVTGFGDPTDVTVSGSATTGTPAIGGAGTTYTVSIPVSAPGTVTAAVPAGVAEDGAGNLNTASPASATVTVVADLTPPTVTIDQGSSQVDPTTTSPVVFDVSFSEDVTGFDETDVNLSGTATASVQSVSGSGATYTVMVAVTAPGTVTASIPAGAAEDAAGNVSEASTSIDATVTVNLDITPPAVVVAVAAGQVDPAITSPVEFTVTFTEVVTGFDAAADVAVSGSATAGVPVVSGSGTTYTVTVPVTSSGTVTLAVPADVAEDAAGNLNTASPADATVTVTLDTTAPTVVVSLASGQVEPITDPDVVFDVEFSEPVTGFATADVVLGGTANPASAAVTTVSASEYTVTVSGADRTGTITVQVAAGGAVDAALNPSTASNVEAADYKHVVTISTGGGDVALSSNEGSVITAAGSAAPAVAPPAEWEFPYGQLSFTADTDPGDLVTFQLTFPNPVTQYFKLVGGTWEEFTWDGTTGAQFNGNVVTVTIQDNGRGDSDPAAGTATDPGAPAVAAADPDPDVTPTPTPTPSPDPGDPTPTPTPTPDGGDPTPTPTPTPDGGGPAPSPTPGPGDPVATPTPAGTPGAGPVNPPGGLPATGGSPNVTLAVAAIATGFGIVLVTVRRRANR